jgi:hypothetical protein
MPSDFERQQRWQLALFGLVLWGVPALIVVAVLAAAGWLIVRLVA